MLSWSEFLTESKAFLERAGGEWIWKDSPYTKYSKQEKASGYLSLREKIIRNTSSISNKELEKKSLNFGNWISIEEDEASLSLSTFQSGEFHVYDCHIVYSPTFNVPVLFFNGYHLDGRLLSLEEVLQDVPKQYRREESWSFLSQDDHPILGIPFYYIHPCGTQSLMKTLRMDTIRSHLCCRSEKVTEETISTTTTTTSSSSLSSPVEKRECHYLLSWLSLYGPVIGLPAVKANYFFNENNSSP